MSEEVGILKSGGGFSIVLIPNPIPLPPVLLVLVGPIKVVCI